MTQLTQRGILELVSHEAIVRQTYIDSVGVKTWSVGITNASGHSVERYIGKPQTMERCLEVFAWALQRYEQDVLRAFSGFELKEHELAAAVSFHYNTGGIFKASWVKHFKAGEMTKARAAFMRWNKPAEIIGRRQKECDLFFEGKWSSNGNVTEYTRVTPTMRPDWGSAKRVDIRKPLSRAVKVSPRPKQRPPFWAKMRSWFR